MEAEDGSEERGGSSSDSQEEDDDGPMAEEADVCVGDLITRARLDVVIESVIARGGDVLESGVDGDGIVSTRKLAFRAPRSAGTSAGREEVGAATTDDDEEARGLRGSTAGRDSPGAADRIEGTLRCTIALGKSGVSDGVLEFESFLSVLVPKTNSGGGS
jgi:hypothetical protein